MLENLYTTKMSMNKEKLQNRFSKIRSKNGLISKAFSLIMAAVIITTMLYATVVMAIMNKQETEQTENNKIQGTNISYSSQNIDENANNYPIKTDIAQTITDEKKIKSTSVSEELYVGFEQIVLSDINSTEIKKELQIDGITQTQSTPVDLEQNYIVNDFKAKKTQVKADANGNISIYMSVESDNLFDVQITDSETNEHVGQFTILANNDNVYSFLGFEEGKNYNIEVKSKTQNDWNISGNYILY